MKKIRLLIISMLSPILFFTSIASADNPNKITPDGYVTDRAGLFTDDTKKLINEQQEKFNQTETKPEIAVLTVDDLNGQSIADFTNTLTHRSEWKPGKKGENNGVLIVYSKSRHHMRIATGTKTETYLTDADVNSILQKHKSDLQSNNNKTFNEAFQATYKDIVNKLPTTNSRLEKAQKISDKQKRNIALVIITIIIIACILITIVGYASGDGFILGMIAGDIISSITDSDRRFDRFGRGDFGGRRRDF